MTFNEFNFDERLFEGIDSMGFKTATPIQEQTIPLIAEGNDLIACAQTGTGKTASYLLPVLDALCKSDEKAPISALILAPTRELAMQIDQQVEGLAYFTGLSSIAIYGGGDGMGFEQQRRSLKEGVDLVIATPGRLLAHMNTSAIDWSGLRFLVLDEADRMLDMGFKDDLMKIVRSVPTQRQTLLFSATMPPKIRQFAGVLLSKPKEVNIAISQPAEKILQLQYRVYDEQKIGVVKDILNQGDYKSVIIFASTKESVKNLDKEMQKNGFSSKAFHSDLGQEEREQLLLRFKNRKLNILVGTDVLSRGIDIDGIDLVINYDVPPDPEDYIHRIGRTARAEKTGTAITLVNNRDYGRFKGIERLMGREVDEAPVPEELGPAPKGAPLRKSNDTQRKKKKNGARRKLGNRNANRGGDVKAS
ncbi:DEAD/DEAH box helicase [Olivibacter sitiensis]|uniref:DEAD/DEAH box helicase n=1 Tax=Olivibacter sitiensis TaxID=376470 RepID=UPI00048775A4|nr:DEAD/DEAH box helicase [Olivibacter sitiensis]